MHVLLPFCNLPTLHSADVQMRRNPIPNNSRNASDKTDSNSSYQKKCQWSPRALHSHRSLECAALWTHICSSQNIAHTQLMVDYRITYCCRIYHTILKEINQFKLHTFFFFFFPLGKNKLLQCCLYIPVSDLVKYTQWLGNECCPENPNCSIYKHEECPILLGSRSL